MRVGFIVK